MKRTTRKTAPADAFLVRKRYLQYRFDMPFSWPDWLPLPLEIRYRMAMRTINEILGEALTWTLWLLAAHPAERHRVREGTKIYLSPWVVHRDPRYYPGPARFLPERFLPGEIAQRPKLSYFPFGAGPRLCIGHHLARIEATLVPALLVRDWEFQRGSHPAVKPSPRMVLQPSVPVWTDVSMAAAS